MLSSTLYLYSASVTKLNLIVICLLIAVFTQVEALSQEINGILYNEVSINSQIGAYLAAQV